MCGKLYQLSPSPTKYFTDFEEKSMQKEKGVYASSYAPKAQLTVVTSTKQRQKGSVAARAGVVCVCICV
jgi:hypothetical protein